MASVRRWTLHSLRNRSVAVPARRRVCGMKAFRKLAEPLCHGIIAPWRRSPTALRLELLLGRKVRLCRRLTSPLQILAESLERPPELLHIDRGSFSARNSRNGHDHFLFLRR
jgi:hypothetical protein